MGTKIGIIAGEGDFPFLVAQGVRDFGDRPIVVAISGHTREEISALADEITWIHLGQLGKMISFFKKSGVERIVFAGAINKPKALNIRPDFRAARLLFRLKSHSDNAILQGVVEELEKEGFSVISPVEYVPTLQTPKGIITKKSPSKKEKRDIRYGWPIAKKLGEMDIGQTIVVKDKMVIAVEAIEGTNNTILRAGSLVGQGCVVIKVFKPNQVSVVDQPSIGLATIDTMKQAGCSVLVIEAGKSLFFERERAIQLANECGISIVGIEESPDELG